MGRDDIFGSLDARKCEIGEREMEFVWFLLIAVVSGVLAGMGMGGGTLLIPALTIIMDVEQEIAQSVNLLAFVPCAVICIIIYSKNKLIDFKVGISAVVPSLIVAVIAVLVAVKIESKILKMIFGAFIALLGAVQLVVYIINKIKNKLKKTEQNS